jgi:uncharacterized protein (TIGR03790 family)
MPITSENIIVLYRNGNADSLAFAEGYQALYDLADEQLVSVSCSGSQILASYEDFQTEIENDVADAIDDLDRDIKVILVGYGVPGGFFDSSDIISTQSRLSRIGHEFSKQAGNVLFDRRNYNAYDTDAAEKVLIVSRIDAPSITVALEYIESLSKVIRKGTVNGGLFFDKWAVLDSDADTTYQNDLISFETRVLPFLNITVSKTSFWDEYTDVVVPRLSNDSFMWGFRSSRAGYTFFKDTVTSRIFLYNADPDGAEEMRDAEDKRFPMLALSSGYAATAGAMSDPTPDGYLRPRPFFEALLRGATIGEAYTFSVPYVDWTVGLFGDPLLKVTFPAAPVINDDLSMNTGWDMLHDNLARSIAFRLAANEKLNDAVTLLASNNELLTKVELLSAWKSASSVDNATWQTPYSALATQLVELVINNSQGQSNGLVNYLKSRGIKINGLLLFVLNRSISSALVIPEGQWTAEFVIEDTSASFTNYHFTFDVATDIDFENIVHTYNSEHSVTNWYYEAEVGQFVTMPARGVPSNFVGRRVRFVSEPSHYLDRGDVFYYRVRQVG